MIKNKKEITFDFSDYFSEKKVYKLNISNQDPIQNSINKLIKSKKELKSSLKNNPQYFYVNEREIDKRLNPKENKIENGDTIIVLKSKLKNKDRPKKILLPILDVNSENIKETFNDDISIHKKSENNKLNREVPISENEKENEIIIENSKCCLIKIMCHNNKINLFISLIIIFAIIVTGVFITLVILLNKRLKEDKNNIKYENEKLISKLEYRENQIYNLLYKKEIKNMYELNDMTDLSNKKEIYNMTQYIHYILGVEKEEFEIDEHTKIKKKYYNAFLSIDNITIENETDIITNLYFMNFNELKDLRILEKNKKKRNLHEKQIIIIINNETNITQPIIEFDFYQNGEIKEIYIPNNLEKSLFDNLYELIENFIPVLKENVYCNNITEELNKINKDSLDDNKEENEENEIKKEEEENTLEDDGEERRRLKVKDKKVIKYKIISFEQSILNEEAIRRLNIDSNETENITDYIKEIEYIDSTEDKNYSDINLREYSSQSQDLNSNTNIKQYKQGLAGNEEQTLKNSSKIIHSFIEIDDNLGIIKFINMNSSVEMNDNSNEDDYNSNNDENQGNVINENTFNSLEDNFDNKDNSINDNNFTSSINSSFKSMIYIANNTILNKDNFININKEIVNKLKEYFKKYDYKLYNETIYGNKTMRILKDLSHFINEKNNINKEIIVEDIPLDEYKKEKKDKKLRTLIEVYEDTYYGLRNVDIKQNVYKANLLGLNIEGEVQNKINQANGKTMSYCHSYFGKIKISYNVNNIQTNIHIITKNLNEMVKSFISILNSLEEDLIKRSKNYSEIIINLEKDISDMINKTNMYDFSGTFKNPLKNMYDAVNNFTSNLFGDFLLLINESHSNYTLILNDTENDKLETFKKIREITKNKYIEYINSTINNLDIFSNNTLNYLNDLEELIKDILNFQIDILYDIIDNIEEAKKIFKNFCFLLFNSITKGINIFKYDLSEHLDEMIGEFIYITEFVAYGLENDDLLRNSLNEETRIITISQLKDFKNIINIIINNLIEGIFNDYNNEMLNSNPQGIKFLTEIKTSQLFKEFEKNSSDLITSIKLKIQYLEKYELYSFNIDKINIINYDLENNLYYNSNEKIIKNIINIKRDFLNESSEIIKNKNKLFNITKKIKNEINKGINEIYDKINIYYHKYKDENIYNFLLNLYHFRESFLDESMSSLLNEFMILINDTININLKELIKYNYDLGFQYLKEEKAFFNEFRYKSRKIITSGFIKKYSKFIESFKEILSLIYSDLTDIFEKNFYNLKEKILNHVKNKLSSINKYYFNSDKYSNSFYFISGLSNEILDYIQNINNYYNENVFNGKIEINVLNLIQTILYEYDKKLDNTFQKLYKYLYDKSDKIKSDDRDFCWSRWRLFKGWKNTYLYTPHTNNIDKVVKDLNQTKIYVENYKNQIYDKFIHKFDNYLDSCIKISNNFYSNLYSFTENKINNNDNLNKLLNEYQNVFYGIINNNSYTNLINKIEKNENINDKIEIVLKEIRNGLEKIKDEYYDFYYLNNQSDFLEYPYEIIIKCNQIINELNDNSNYIKLTINSLYKEKIKNIIKETNYFIKEINNNNYKYISSHLNYSYNFMNYFDVKTGVLNIAFQNYENYFKISEKEILKDFNYNILNNLNYDLKFTNIINNIEEFINEFNQIIYDNFTQIICENNTHLINEEEEIENNIDLINEGEEIENNIDLINEEEEIENIINETNLTNITCEFQPNYSKYNFQIVKIRNAIYYVKNLYEELDEIYKNELRDENGIAEKIINKEYIKEKDYKINEKNVWLIYNESLNHIKNLNEESKNLLKDYYEIFKEDFFERYPFINEKNKQIFKENIQILNKTLNDNYHPFKNKINNDLNKIYQFLLNDYNEILNKIFSEINEYDYYSFNETKLNQTFMSFYNSLNNIFNNYLNNVINKVNKDYNFYNAFSYSIKNLYYTQFKIYGENIKEYSKSFNFELFNSTSDLDKYIIDILENDYNNLEFSFVFDYIELYDKYNNKYQKNLNNIIINLRDKALQIFKNNSNIFLNNLKNSKSHVSKDFIFESMENYSNCENYSMIELDEIILEDEKNWEKYENYTKLLEYYLNLTNNTNSTLEDLEENFEENLEEINLEDLEEITYFNKTEYWLYCNNYNFFNYTNIIFEDLDSTNKQLINNILNKINEEINNNKFDSKYLYNFLENEFSSNIIKNNNLSLNELSNNLFYLFDNFQDLCEYSFNKIEKKYINHLKDLFVKYFNISYSDFVNNYLFNEINITSHVIILETINSKLNYIKNKIIEENKYYLFLLNNITEIGITSKEVLLNLYPSLSLKINNSLYELFEKIFNEEMTFFFRENKKIFFENFINYLNENNNNEKNNFREIHGFYKYFSDLISDRNFNKSLEIISTNLLYDNIINKIKENYYSIINQKMIDLQNILFDLNNQIKEELNKITIFYYSEDMEPIINENNKYMELINEQNNKFIFNIDDEPFILIDNFTSFYLEPPLSQIKEYYNKIEDELLNQLFYLINNFDDIYGIIKNKFEEFYNIENIQLNYNLSDELLNNYINNFSNEIYDIKNQLFYYTYINGLDSNNKSRNLNKINNKVNLSKYIKQNNNEYYKSEFNKNEKNNKEKKDFKNTFEFHNKRNLNSNSKEGSFSLSNIINAFKAVNTIFSLFSQSYLSSDFKKILNNLNFFL